jgi:hypothetical protein
MNIKIWLCSSLILFGFNRSYGQTNNKNVQHEKNNTQSIVFGIFCGECSHYCAIMYQYGRLGNVTTLSVDSSDSYFKNRGGQMTFGTKILDRKKFILAEEIFEHVPDSFFLTERTSQTFGCPDCRDGCGIYFEMLQNFKVKKFYIDYQTATLEGETKKFAEFLIDTLRKFKY